RGAEVHQPRPFVSKIPRGTLLRHLPVARAALWGNHKKESARAVAFIVVIQALRLPWVCRQAWSGLVEPWLARLIKVDLGTGGVLRLPRGLQHGLPPRQ